MSITDFDPAAAGYSAPVPDALDLVLEVSTMVSVHQAEQLMRVAALRDEAVAEAGRYGTASPEIAERSLRLELATAMRVTEYAAGELLMLADAVVHRYPAVLASLAGARMTQAHAKALVTALDTVEPHLRDDLVPEAVALAQAQPVGVFRRTLAARVDTVRHATLAARHADAVQGRRLVVQPGQDGMAWLMNYLPAVEAHAGFERATKIAKQLIAAGREGTLDQVRSDVAADLLIDGVVPAHPKKAHGIRATVVVTVPALALLDTERPADTGTGTGTGTGTDTGPGGPGAANPGAARVRHDPPTVEGIGPIPIERARELCGGAKHWMRVLTHPETGMVLSVGRKKYRPPPALALLAKWRADRCMGPGCGVPASRSQIDHTHDWALGGQTSLQNTAPLCQGHHTIKHHGGWTVRQIEGSGGALEWISPMGRRYVVAPERRIPTFTTAPDTSPAPF